MVDINPFAATRLAHVHVPGTGPAGLSLVGRAVGRSQGLCVAICFAVDGARPWRFKKSEQVEAGDKFASQLDVFGN